MANFAYFVPILQLASEPSIRLSGFFHRWSYNFIDQIHTKFEVIWSTLKFWPIMQNRNFQTDGWGAKFYRKNLKKNFPILDLPYNIGICTNIAQINSFPRPYSKPVIGPVQWCCCNTNSVNVSSYQEAMIMVDIKCRLLSNVHCLEDISLFWQNCF